MKRYFLALAVLLIALNLLAIDCLELRVYNKIFQRRLNSTDVLKTVSAKLGISPPWNAPSWIWSWSWKIHHFFLPILHATDRCNASETFVNLPVLWWKAIAGNRRNTISDDDGYAFDLLPPITRNLIRFPFCWLFPNLHHQNVAIRTLYLDNMVNRCIEQIAAAEKKEQPYFIEVITIGAGFDTRSLRYLNKRIHVEDFLYFHEIDLPNVIAAKQCMFGRLQSRRPHQSLRFPNLYNADLNFETEVKIALEKIQSNIKSRNHEKRKIYTIFIMEAVAMYLIPGATESLLKQCNLFIKDNLAGNSYFCFADRFPDSNKGLTLDIQEEEEKQMCKTFLSDYNYDLIDFLPKPGRARHMGLAISKLN